jgi:hypothetical protein
VVSTMRYGTEKWNGSSSSVCIVGTKVRYVLMLYVLLWIISTLQCPAQLPAASCLSQVSSLKSQVVNGEDDAMRSHLNFPEGLS